LKRGSLILRQLWASFVIKAEKERGLTRKPRVQELPEEEARSEGSYQTSRPQSSWILIEGRTQEKLQKP